MNGVRSSCDKSKKVRARQARGRSREPYAAREQLDQRHPGVGVTKVRPLRAVLRDQGASLTHDIVVSTVV